MRPLRLSAAAVMQSVFLALSALSIKEPEPKCIGSSIRHDEYDEGSIVASKPFGL